MKSRIRWNVFLPPWALILAALICSFVDYEGFVNVLDIIVSWILDRFSWLFCIVALLAVIITVVAYILPFGKVKIGGLKSQPLISYSNYVWIVLCTIMGAGLMLWACAEPLYHLYYPPANVTEGAMSAQAVVWSMETLFLEWSFTPMAITALVAVLFGFCFYNMKKSFSISSMLSPLFGDKVSLKLNSLVDGLCLFCLCAGLSSSLGSGIMLVSGGVNAVSGGAVTSGVNLWIISGIVIIAAFVISAATGLTKGIKTLSRINTWFYLALGIIVFLAGPTVYILNLCMESLGAYLSDFFRLSLMTSAASGDGWAQSWPVFYWCMALSWMPVSAVFLGRISRGFTVRQALNAMFIIPSVFCILWMSLFAGSSIYYELGGAEIMSVIQSQGLDAAVYEVLRQMPLSAIIIPLFLITAFISYVTSADSNTNAAAGLCCKGLQDGESESPVWIKIVWGITVGALSIVMLTAYDMEGMKKLATLGGLPAVFLMLLFMASFLKVARDPAKYDTHKEDYDEKGRVKSFVKKEKLV